MSGNRNRRKHKLAVLNKLQKNAKGGSTDIPEEEKLDPQVQALKAEGNKFFLEQKYAQALEKYNEAIRLCDHHAALFSNRSASHAFLNNFREALEDAERCIRLQPAWSKGFFRKGRALEGLIKYPEALQAYEAGLELTPDDPPLKKAKADLLILTEDLKSVEHEILSPNPDSDKFQHMVDWLISGGSQFPKLYLKYYSENFRGVHAASRINEEEVFLVVPHKFIMTSDLAKESDIGRKIVDTGVELRSKHSYLASFLLQEKHRHGSTWDPYLNILPDNFRNMPIFFDETELAYLRGSPTMEKIHERIDSLRREYDNLCKHIPDYHNFTHEEFVWARMVVITRIFGLVINDVKTDGLVPYADMLNHLRPRETKWTYDDSRQGFIISALKVLKKGDQVYDSYGRKCNSRFFVNYGFSIVDNEDNEYAITLGLDKNDKLYAMKLKMLGDITKSVREFSVRAAIKEKKTQEMFSFLRYMHAQDSELMLLQAGDDGKNLENIEPISIRNETACLRKLEEVCLDYLAKFPDPVEEDDRLLREGNLNNNIRNCVVMRKGEKDVLWFYIKLARTAIPLLQMPWKDLKRTAAKYHGEGPYDSYITSVVTGLVRRAN